MDKVYRVWLLTEMRRKRIAAFVAVTKRDGVAGSLLVWVRDIEPDPVDGQRKAPFLSAMFVEPDQRRKGIGSALVLAAVRWCRSRRYPYVTGIPVNHARRLLPKLGFEPLLSEMGLLLDGKAQR
jgi:GNAT superfamily N-acetyltransferase